MTEETKNLIKLLEVLGELNKTGLQVKREINAVLTLLMISFGLNKETLDSLSQ